jgi:hypothetical protein
MIKVFLREETLKEKLLRKKRERIQEKQQEEVKVELDNYSDDEYDTQKRFKVILYLTFLRLLEAFFMLVLQNLC